jgi:hypothetical protein
MGLSMSVCLSHFSHIAITLTLDHIAAAMPLDAIVAFDTTVAFVIFVIALFSDVTYDVA